MRDVQENLKDNLRENLQENIKELQERKSYMHYARLMAGGMCSLAGTLLAIYDAALSDKGNDSGSYSWNGKQKDGDRKPDQVSAVNDDSGSHLVLRLHTQPQAGRVREESIKGNQ